MHKIDQFEFPVERLKRGKIRMKSGNILLAFFSIFAVASIIIPMPMFPGSWFCNLFGERIQDYVRVFSAFFNGAFYGGILWLMFVGLGKKLEQ